MSPVQQTAGRNAGKITQPSIPQGFGLHFVSRPGEDFRQALHSAMPKLLTNGQKTAKEEMRELIAIVRPVALRERLLKVWAKW